MNLRLNSTGKAVVLLQNALTKHAIFTTPDGIFGHETQKNVIEFQRQKNLVPDGVVGSITKNALGIEEPTATSPVGVTKPLPPVATPVVNPPGGVHYDTGDDALCPWVGFLNSRLGWTEFDHDQQLSVDWHLSGLNYKTVIGLVHAWCAMEANASLYYTGYVGTHNAGALSFEHLGIQCEFKRGAWVPIRHANGGSHITCFLYWVDEKNKIFAGIGGNQGDSIKVSHFNISGNHLGHDECVSGPRWPIKAIA